MISKYTVKKFCKDDISLIENFEKAISDKEQTWHCHHRRELETPRKELIEIGEYYNRPAEELIFLTEHEHRVLHNKGNKNWLGRHHTEYTKIKIAEGNKGKKLLEETKQKISNSLKGKPSWNKGKHHTEESKLKMSIAKKGNKNRLGIPCSDEAKRKISESNKGKPSHWKGIHLYEETKRKISAAKQGIHWFNNGIISVTAKSCPEGFVKGRLKKAI